MVENIDIGNKKDIIKEIREKIKNNPKYINPCGKEFQEDIKRYGFENGNKFISWMQQKGILKDHTKIDHRTKEKTLENMGFKNQKEYKDHCAKRRGYKNDTERKKEQRWNRGVRSPMSENEDCAYYLGIHIAERLLSTIYQDVTRMPANYPYYDFICNKGYKIQVKARCILKSKHGYPRWEFKIDYNDVADYFILVAFDNRDNLNPMHIWLIGKNEIVRERKFYRRTSIVITNKPLLLLDLKKYEQIDKLEKLKEHCEEFKEQYV